MCKLNKALYGLRQAGRQWNKKLNQVLQGLGLKPAAADNTCLYFDSNEYEFTVLVVYVDDILYISWNPRRVEGIKTGLAKSCDIKDLGLANFCLGIEVFQEDGEILLFGYGATKKKSARKPTEIMGIINQQFWYTNRCILKILH